MSAITVILILFIIGYLLWRYLPQILMWYVRRRLEKSVRQAFGQEPGPKRQRQQRQQQPRPARRGKIIGSDVGEYVEFEEISVQVQAEAPRHKVKPEPQVADADWEDID